MVSTGAYIALAVLTGLIGLCCLIIAVSSYIPSLNDIMTPETTTASKWTGGLCVASCWILMIIFIILAVTLGNQAVIPVSTINADYVLPTTKLTTLRV